MAKIRIKKLPPEPPVSHYKLRWACSFFGLTAPVWIPILFYAIPMSKKLAESVSSFGMLGMLVLPFIPLALWEGRRLRTYLTILMCATPFLMVAAFLLGWIALMVHFGP